MLGSRALSVTITSASRFRGRFRLAGDKGISHRLAIFAALAEGRSRIDNYSSGADCASTLSCLRALGVRIERRGGEVVVEGRGADSWKAPAGPLDCGNSGSTLRMMAGALAGRPFASTLTGDDSLRRRPVERVAAPLRAMGAKASGTFGKPPLTIEGGSLKGITFDMPVASAQVKTAVLLAGLQAEGTTTVKSPAESRDHTERLLPVFGVPVERSGLAVSVKGGARLTGADVTVAGDASSAAFLVVAALIRPDSEVHIDHVLLNPGRLGFVDVLRSMGADIEVTVESTAPEPMGSLVARSSRLRGVDVLPAAVPGIIDEIPALCVAAAHAEGRFTVSGAAELRVKESDRIAALAEGLSRMGARVEERPDGLAIDGGTPLHGAAVRAHEDHRIAMALAVAGLAAQGGTEIEGAECASVSFPEFYGILEEATGHA
jgi:3-phosphoshikimate 1-carboxyvinyltransferase